MVRAASFVEFLERWEAGGEVQIGLTVGKGDKAM